MRNISIATYFKLDEHLLFFFKKIMHKKIKKEEESNVIGCLWRSSCVREIGNRENLPLSIFQAARAQNFPAA